MKNIILFCFAILLLLGCKKEPQTATDNFNDPYFNGTMTALRNGKPKTLRVHAQLDSSNRLAIAILDYHNDFGWDKFGISNLNPNIGYSELEDYRLWTKLADSAIKKQSYIYYNGSFDNGWDAISFSFLQKDHPHFLNITKYDKVAKEISGTFSVSFAKEAGFADNDPYDLDTVTYTDATFTAPVWNWKDVKY